MKKSFLVLFLVLAIAISSPAWAADVVYKLTYSAADDENYQGSGDKQPAFVQKTWHTYGDFCLGFMDMVEF